MLQNNSFQQQKKEDALLSSSFLHYKKAYSIPPIQIGQILNRNIPSLFQGIVPQKSTNAFIAEHNVPSVLW